MRKLPFFASMEPAAAHESAPVWMQHAPRADDNPKARIATELVVGLPHELTAEQRKILPSGPEAINFPPPSAAVIQPAVNLPRGQMPEALEKKANEEIAIGRDALLWWDPLLVLVFALVGWFIIIGGPALLLGGSLRDFDPRIASPSRYTTNAQRFYALHVYAATLYLAVLIVMCVLARRRGFRLFTDYFASIPFRSTLSAALLGSGIGGTFCLVFLGSRTVATVPMLHYRLGWLVVSGLALVIIAPVVEELYFRGILLDCLKHRFSPLLSTRMNAVAFALLHFRFLFHPGISGWIETIWIGLMGLLLARLALRDDSLRAPVAAHAGFNAMFVLCIFFLK
jgi:membrane protease YdiL (CAAX protease family)